MGAAGDYTMFNNTQLGEQVGGAMKPMMDSVPAHWLDYITVDDSYEHEVHNDTDEVRVVLFLDFDRPMDALGRVVNAAVVGLIRLSPYVRDPLKNLATWNKAVERA